MSAQNHYESLARSLTIDQAFARAYGDVRRLCTSAADNLLEPIERHVMLSAVEAVAKRLEVELSELMYGQETAEKLARPV